MKRRKRDPLPQGHFDVVLFLSRHITAALSARTKREADEILIHAQTNAQTFYLNYEPRPKTDS